MYQLGLLSAATTASATTKGARTAGAAAAAATCTTGDISAAAAAAFAAMRRDTPKAKHRRRFTNFLILRIGTDDNLFENNVTNRIDVDRYVDARAKTHPYLLVS